MTLIVDPTKDNLKSIFNKRIDALIYKTRKTWQATAPTTIKDNIISTIERGNSPVHGEGRFAQYSTSYKNAILGGSYTEYAKRVNPVNMTLSGTMLKSLASRKTTNGFAVYFTNKLAKIHSVKGAGKAKVIRKIIPQGEEEFKKSIIKESADMISDMLQKGLRNIFY